MPSWQSNLFRQFARLSRPRVAGASTDIAELRGQYTYLTDRFGPAPGDGFSAGAGGPIKGEWVKSGAGSAERLILYFHGGGYVAGSPETHRPLIARLGSRREATCLLARLSPGAGIRVSGGGARRHRRLSPSVAKGVVRIPIVSPAMARGGGLAFAC